MQINDIFNRLEAQENSLCGSRVLAPVIAGRTVSVKVGGITCRLKIDGKTQRHGWSVLEVVSSERAIWLRAATKVEREKYLSLLPRVRFIALEQSKSIWAAYPAHAGDARFQLNGAAPIREVEAGIQPFDTIVTRFDGTHFWFEAPDSRRSPALAAYLRESLVNGIAPVDLQKKGLSNDERAAYALALYGPADEPELELPSIPQFGETDELNPINWRNGVATRLARSVNHGGGQLVSYIERDGVYSVTYKFGERTHTSTVRASDLRVETSGICLSGMDNDFDLTSLVGVMQEASVVEPWQFDGYDY